MALEYEGEFLRSRFDDLVARELLDQLAVPRIMAG